jgi:hypothetical protein
MTDRDRQFDKEAAQKIAKWQDQCFLTDARHILAETNRKILGYENLIVFNTTADKAAKKFTAMPDSEIFFKLNPAQMALLVPTIRFWVVFYDQKKDSGPSGGYHSYSNSKELFLDDFTSKAQVSAIEKSLSGKGRAYGIGLKDFNYEFDGGDFATTEKSIKVKAQFLLTSFNSLEKKQRNGARWLDILLRTPKKIPKSLEKAYAEDKQDLLTACRAPAIRRDSARADENLISNPAYKRIKARVGWAATDVHALVDLFDADVKRPTPAAMKNMLESLQLDLFLEMTNYDFNFENDGKTTLTVDYRASVEGSLREPSANLFYRLQEQIKNKAAARDKRIASLERQKTDYEEQAGERLGSARESDPETAPGERPEPELDSAGLLSNRLALLDKKITDVNNEYSDIIEIWKYSHYNLFLEKMLLENKIYEIILNKEDLLQWRGYPGASGRKPSPGLKENSSEDYAASRKKTGLATKILKAKFATTTRADEPSAPGAGGPQALPGHSDNSLKCEIKALKEDIRALTGRARIRGGMRESPPPTRVDPVRCADYPRRAFAPGTHAIHFMFLGDIIDTIMGIHKENAIIAGLAKEDLNLRVVTTDIIDINPGDGKRKNLNIADIPISLEEFNAFYRRKVINPRVSQYFIMDFIKDLMTELVYRALGGACWASQNAVIPSFTYTLYDAKRTEKNPEPWIKKSKGGFFKRGAPRRSASPDTLRTSPGDVGPRKVMNYFVLHGSLRTTAKRKTNRRRDEQDGIYHFGLGLRRGILKEVKFISNKMVHANTARVLADGAAGIDQLFNKFDADVELYGCPLFRNGQYIFIDPKTMGVNSEISRALGMGGYYNIYNVRGKLSREGYKTTLKCKFNSSGICDDKRTVEEDALQPMAPPAPVEALRDPEDVVREREREFMGTVFAAGAALAIDDEPLPADTYGSALAKVSETSEGRTRILAVRNSYIIKKQAMYEDGLKSDSEMMAYNDELNEWKQENQRLKREQADYYKEYGVVMPVSEPGPPEPTEPAVMKILENQAADTAFRESGMQELMDEAQVIENQDPDPDPSPLGVDSGGR